MFKLSPFTISLVLISFPSSYYASVISATKTRDAYYQVCSSNGHNYFTNIPHQTTFYKQELPSLTSPPNEEVCKGTPIAYVRNNKSCTPQGLESFSSRNILYSWQLKQFYSCTGPAQGQQSTEHFVTVTVGIVQDKAYECNDPAHPFITSSNQCHAPVPPDPVEPEKPVTSACQNQPDGTNVVSESFGPYTQYYASSGLVNPFSGGQPSQAGTQYHDYQRGFERNDATSMSTIVIQTPEGTYYQFVSSGNGSWPGSASQRASFTETLDGAGNTSGYTLTKSNDVQEVFNASGQLTSIIERNGNTTTLAYNANSELSSVTDPFSKTTTFSYNANGQVTQLTDPDGEVTKFEYDASGNRTKAILPDNTPGDDLDNPTRLYHFEDSNFPHLITGITDESGVRIKTWSYDTEGRVLTEVQPNSINNLSYTYNIDGTTTVTNPLGKDTVYHFETFDGIKKISRVEGIATSSCAGSDESREFDNNGFIVKKTDKRGFITTYKRDNQGRELARTEAVGTSVERTITTHWHDEFNLPEIIRDPNQQLNISYDATTGYVTNRTIKPVEPPVGDEVYVPAPNDFIAEWTMDSINGSTIVESTGNFDAEIIHDAPQVEGFNGKAVDFNGFYQYAITPHDISLEPTNISVCARINAEADMDHPGDIVSKNWYVHNYSGHSGYRLMTYPTGVAFFLGTGDPASIQRGVTHETARYDVTLSQGVWYHICGTYDGSEIKLFFDGELKVTQPHTIPIGYKAASPLSIGTRTNYGGSLVRFFNGKIDDVRIYDRALTESEVSALHTSSN